MTKTSLAAVSRKIQNKREQAKKLHEDIEDMIDYLDILQARAENMGKPTFSETEIRKRLKA